MKNDYGDAKYQWFDWVLHGTIAKCSLELKLFNNTVNACFFTQIMKMFYTPDKMQLVHVLKQQIMTE